MTFYSIQSKKVKRVIEAYRAQIYKSWEKKKFFVFFFTLT